MALTQVERTRKHRWNKRIELFCSDYLEGQARSTLDEFVEAMEAEFCDKHSVGNVSFQQSALNDFYKEAEMLPETDEDVYEVSDLYELWERLKP